MGLGDCNQKEKRTIRDYDSMYRHPTTIVSAINKSENQNFRSENTFFT